MSISTKHKILPITKKDLLIYRLCQSNDIKYLKCRDSNCKQCIYKIHDKHFKTKIGNHLSLCRFYRAQSDDKHKDETNETSLLRKRKASNEYNSTSSDSKDKKTQVKVEKVGVFEIKDVASSNGNSTSIEMDIEDLFEEEERSKEMIMENKGNGEYEKMFAHFVGFMECFIKYCKGKGGDSRKDNFVINEFKGINVKKIPSDLGEIDINN